MWMYMHLFIQAKAGTPQVEVENTPTPSPGEPKKPVRGRLIGTRGGKTEPNQLSAPKPDKEPDAPRM